MAKLLRPTTIIPPELYVERDADRQLDSIISEMGRPGYVLVARQMGKTNLLVHMKRRRETAGDIVSYFDLSQRVDSPRALFRHVIDSIIDSNPSVFAPSLPLISTQRQQIEVEPNVEYDRHLRILLRTAPDRRIVVVFDEIDSLTSVEYSDVVFAQIRSMYFSRINYREYDRLTYVLSGVAEPTDLIKDKNISPFNIGEKIYLDDFNQSEFATFLEKSNLTLENDVADEVYSWTGGNPRMTWDVCSKLEDLRDSGRSISIDDVDRIVEKLYLTRFDQAPVDHIRVLVENDPQIRSAIMSIRWGKEGTLDEKIKSRLYLAGVSRSVPGETPAIKNRIIDVALSDDWLKQIALLHKGRLELAGELFQKGHHKESIRLIEEYLKLSPPDEQLPLGTKLDFGIASYFTGDYATAIRELQACLGMDLNEELRATCRYYLGSSLILSGAASDAAPLLRQAAGYSGPVQNLAKIALSSALLRDDSADHSEEVIEIGQSIVDSIGSPGNPAPEESSEILAAAHFAIAQAHQRKGAVQGARQHYAIALEVAPPKFRPAILIRGDTEINPAARQAAAIIIGNRLKVVEGNSSALDLTESAVAGILVALSVPALGKEFFELLSYLCAEAFEEPISSFDLLFRIYSSQRSKSSFASLLEIATDRYIDETVPPDKIFQAYRQLAINTRSDRRDRIIRTYFDLLDSRIQQGLKPDDQDLLLLLNYGTRLIDQREHRRALRVLKIAHMVANKNPTIDTYFLAVLWYQELLARNGLSEMEDARSAAEKLIEILDGSTLLQDSAYSDSAAIFHKTAINFLQSFRPMIEVPKIGRNRLVSVRDRTTGAVFEAKFKKVSDRLYSGALELVERQPAPEIPRKASK